MGNSENPVDGELNAQQVREACDLLFDTEASTLQKVDFLRQLHQRGETVNEITLFAKEILERGIPLPPMPFPITEVCGTGGDRLGLFNVSTTVMFVAAACGVRIVKIGNRAATSLSGAADVLEALNVNLALAPEAVPAVVEAAGCAFLFAPAYYPGLQAVAAARRLLAEEGLPSIFNFLGPLLNPARPSHQLVGLWKPSLVEDYAEVLHLLGRKVAWTVCGRVEGGGAEGMDEISTLGETVVCFLKEGKKKMLRVYPEHFGLPLANREDLLGGNAKENARFLVEILDGAEQGPRRDLVLANTAAVLCLCEITPDFPSGMRLALEAIASGEALRRLHALVQLTNRNYHQQNFGALSGNTESEGRTGVDLSGGRRTNSEGARLSES